MASTRPGRRAVVLSSADLSVGPGHLLHSCEDCACEVNHQGIHPALAVPPLSDAVDKRWVVGHAVVEIPLDGMHSAVFNPMGNGGVVVVDETARQIVRSFDDPATVAEARQRVAVDLRGEFESVVERLHRFALIEPVGCPMRADEAVSEILTAWLHITNDCNLRCRYCYLNKTRETMDERTGRAALEAVVGTAVRHGFAALKLKYAGGEASLEPELVLALHAYARELTSRHGLALHATLLTNGVAMPPGLAEALLACDIRVMVSFDGVGDSHDAQRLTASGGPSFRSVERTIARLTRIGIAPHLSITLTKLNAAGVADAVRFALERDLTFSLNLFRDAASVAASDDLRCADQPLVSALLEAFAVIEEHLPPWSVLGSVLDRGQLIQPRRHSCGVGRDYVVIDHRGRVAPCHMEIERSLGDVFQDDPLDLVRADNAIARRNPPVEGKEGCCDCTWRYWCSGGCPVATFQTTGRYDLPSPNCDVYRAIYPAVLRLEGLRLLKYSDYPALGS